jgi:hypothetical protein
LRLLYVFLVCCFSTVSIAQELDQVVSQNADHHLGGYVRLKVKSFDGLIRDGLDNVRLQLNGRLLNDARPAVFSPSEGVLEFQLVRTAGDQNAWNLLLGAPPLSGEKTLRLSIAKMGGATYPGAKEIKFRVFAELYLIIAGIFFLALAVILFFLGAYTDMLKDAPLPTTTNPNPARAYSLGRCQMAFWLFLVSGMFVFIWITTGQYTGVLTADALVLLGISGTTGLVAIGVDRTKQAQGLWTPVKNAGSSFLKDIIFADGAPALHRVQMVLWTLILGAVFVRTSYETLQLPVFDATLLAMIGISGTLYIGFKWPEKKGS